MSQHIKSKAIILIKCAKNNSENQEISIWKQNFKYSENKIVTANYN